MPVTGGARPDRSSYSFGKRLRLALNSLVTYTDLPPKLFAGIGLGMVALAFLYSAIVLLQYLIVGQSLPQGLTMIVLLVSGMTGMLMLAIGTLGVYIFRIFQEVLARPRYLVDDTINVRALSETDGRSRR